MGDTVLKSRIIRVIEMFGITCLLVILIAKVACAEQTDEENAKSNNRTYYSDAYWAGHDDDFSKKGLIEADDYNYGWNLGEFSVSGYSAKMENKEGDYVFLKNYGDKINLKFILKQEIHCLNGDKKLYIRELDSRDEYFQTQNIDFGHGTLIIRYTDYEGTKHEPIIYSNYLEALEVGVENAISLDGPDTEVYLLEEGDYEVALDYRIGKERKGPLFIDLKDSFQDYRIFFKFSIRNGNCMTFICDAISGNELTNESVTPNGFIVDMANSKYLHVTITREVMSDGRDGLVEDTRYNRPVSDGEKFTDEGIYTLTTRNIYTGEQTIKKIYVGTDEVMIAYVNSQYSIDEINALLGQGCIINENGIIEYPEVEYKKETTVTEKVSTTDNSTKTEVNSFFYNYRWAILIVAIVGLIVILFAFFTIRKKRNHSNEIKIFSDDNNEYKEEEK